MELVLLKSDMEYKAFFEEMSGPTSQHCSKQELRLGIIYMMWVAKKLANRVRYLDKENDSYRQRLDVPKWSIPTSLGLEDEVDDKEENMELEQNAQPIVNLPDVSTTKQVILTNNPPPRITEFVKNSPAWKDCINYLRNAQLSEGTEVRTDMFSPTVLTAIANAFHMQDDNSRAHAPEFLKQYKQLPKGWLVSFSARQIATMLEYLFPGEQQQKLQHASVTDMLKSKSFNIRSFKKDSMEEYSRHLMEVEEQFSELTIVDTKSAVQTAIDVLKVGNQKKKSAS
jgi:hypothetical protein